jgi:hypothetical protein
MPAARSLNNIINYPKVFYATPKKNTFLLLASLAVTIMTVVAALQSRTQGALSSGKQEEATPIQEGVMSEKQKKHSKLFKGFSNVTRGKNYVNLQQKEAMSKLYTSWKTAKRRDLPTVLNT